MHLKSKKIKKFVKTLPEFKSGKFTGYLPMLAALILVGSISAFIAIAATSDKPEPKHFNVWITVKDKDGYILPASEVELEEKKASTNALGFATFNNIPSGTHKVKANSNKGSGSMEIKLTDEMDTKVAHNFGITVERVYPIVYAKYAALILAGLLAFWLVSKHKPRPKLHVASVPVVANIIYPEYKDPKDFM